MELTKDLELSQSIIEKIKRYIDESGERGVSKSEIFFILENEIKFALTPEEAVSIVQNLIVEEVMDRPEFVKYACVGDYES
jgi:hypothetical protein